jgi:hypothetical protein
MMMISKMLQMLIDKMNEKNANRSLVRFFYFFIFLFFYFFIFFFFFFFFFGGGVFFI